MKCFIVLIILCAIRGGCSQEVKSLSAFALLSSQINFLEDLCFNRTENETIFQDLKQGIDYCEELVLNGTELTLTYTTLVGADPDKFYSLYLRFVKELNA